MKNLATIKLDSDYSKDPNKNLSIESKTTNIGTFNFGSCNDLITPPKFDFKQKTSTDDLANDIKTIKIRKNSDKTTNDSNNLRFFNTKDLDQSNEISEEKL